MIGGVIRVSCVSFFNTVPLVYGLREDPTLALRFDVPSSLLADLEADRADVALLPVIDYQRLAGLRVIPSGGIGCDGPTLTVRFFSRTPIAETTVLAADTASHTSVVLARIILQKQFGRSPEVIPLDAARDRVGETRLVIGDKVITHEPQGFPHQLDLGQAWKELTGLPFVFAVWTARDGIDLGDLPTKLARAHEAGLAHVDELVAREAPPRGWPVDIARKYLTDYLRFPIGERELDAIRRFHQMAHEIGALAHPPYALRTIYDSSNAQ